MAGVVGDYHDDPIPPRPRRDDDYSSFEAAEDETQQPQQQQNEVQPLENEQRLARTETNTSTRSRPREATELDEIRRLSTESTSEGSLSTGEYRVTSRRSGATTTTANSEEERRNRRKKKWVPKSVRRFWARNVTLEVPHKGNRDYFGTSPLPSPPFYILKRGFSNENGMGKHSKEHS